MGNQQAGGHDFMAAAVADTSEVKTFVLSGTMSPEETVVDVAAPASPATVITLPNVALARGKTYVVACRSITSGGAVTVVSGGGDISALPTTTLGVGQYAVFENIGGVIWHRKGVGQEPMIRAGKYTVVAGDVAAGAVITTGLNAIVTAQVMILRGNKCMTDDADITFATGVLTVKTNASLYVITAGDVIHWLVTGT